MYPLTLELLSGDYAVCRLDAEASFPGWARGPMVAVVRTPSELSVVCPQVCVPAQIPCEVDWRCLRVVGPLDFSMTGVISSLSGVLADQDIALFVISTFETDYLLVKVAQLAAAMEALRLAGYTVNASEPS